MIYGRHQGMDLTEYAPAKNDLAAYYGLPSDVKFCSCCVISNQRPNSAVEFKHTKDTKKETIRFDDNGKCDACSYHDVKSAIDWEAREQELRALCDRYRRTDGRYDCLVSGSGGKDSFYTSHLLKYKYGMNPLTVTWAPHIYTDWGWKNFQAWIHAGHDNVLFTPNGRVQRLLARLALENILHPFQPFMLGQKNLAPKIAAQYEIPLIFYGENEAEYGNPRKDNVSAVRDFKYFTADDKSQIFISGVSIANLKADFQLTEVDLAPYMPVNPAALTAEVHYMGYYERWHPQTAYYYAVENSTFQAAPERTAGTYSKYSGIDDKMDDLNFYTTWIKFGIGRATYDAAQEIRNQDITRDEGAALVRRYDGEFPERFMPELLDYLSLPEREFPVAHKQFAQPIMDRAYFDEVCDRFRSPHLWKREDGEWKLRHTVWGSAPVQAGR